MVSELHVRALGSRQDFVKEGVMETSATRRSGLLAALLFLIMSAPGCRAVEDIFKVGFWAGIIVAAIVVAVVVFVIVKVLGG
jgi:hypothetical protein